MVCHVSRSGALPPFRRFCHSGVSGATHFRWRLISGNLFELTNSSVYCPEGEIIFFAAIPFHSQCPFPNRSYQNPFTSPLSPSLYLAGIHFWLFINKLDLKDNSNIKRFLSNYVFSCCSYYSDFPLHSGCPPRRHNLIVWYHRSSDPLEPLPQCPITTRDNTCEILERHWLPLIK